MKYITFKEMLVWQKAMHVATEIFILTKSLPRAEDYGLTSQIRRAALSVSNNIAEGFGRHNNRDKAYYYIVSRDSSFETQNCLEYGLRVEYFKKEETNKICESLNEVIHELNKIIKTLKG
ncbi:MAG TPA: four helix bundle protein [Saprospiraceae bacterium]|nr:four helix bundle protein [Saprospiraceae bacterium]HNT19428.1 four helix bundle protein [Saprospiraceae bacterium]